MAEIITSEHDSYPAMYRAWQTERQPRRIFFGGVEYSAVKDNGLKFVPVGIQTGFEKAYASDLLGKSDPSTAVPPKEVKTNGKTAENLSDE